MEYQQRSTKVASQILPREAVNLTLDGLHPEREGTVTITLVYANGEEAKITATFVTPATGKNLKKFNLSIMQLFYCCFLIYYYVV